jgi:hypothetical protein
MINRRSLITGLISFVSAPAIVKVSSLMPVKLYKDVVLYDWYGIDMGNEIFVQYYDDYHFYNGAQWSEKIIKRVSIPLISNIPESYK